VSSFPVAVRRAVVLLILAAGAASLAAWWRDPSRRSAAGSPPSWPPFETVDTAADPDPGSPRWFAAAADVTDPPDGFPIKVKESSGIYHVPGGRFYDRTRPDRWYATADAAEADGYRPSKT
jgi:hypothetical protein